MAEKNGIKYPKTDLECIRYAVINCDGDNGHLEVYYETDSTQFSDLRQFLSLENVKVVSECSINKHTEIIYDVSDHIHNWIQILTKANPNSLP